MAGATFEGPTMYGSLSVLAGVFLLTIGIVVQRRIQANDRNRG